jgi:hypothetical protein
MIVLFTPRFPGLLHSSEIARDLPSAPASPDFRSSLIFAQLSNGPLLVLVQR